MNVYDLLNINKIDIEEAIKDTVKTVREQYKKLDTDLTCMIYSGAVSDELRKKHVLNRMVDSEDLGCVYNHRFNLVPIEEDYYVIDLTYEQFKSDDFPELKNNGYMLMNDSNFKHYLEIVGYTSIDITVKDAFFKKTRMVK